MLDLSRLFAERAVSDRPVAESGGRLIGMDQVAADVAANAERIRAAGCRRGLLVTQDAYWGAVGLFALLHAGAEAVLPQNGQPGTLAALADARDRVVGDAALEGADDALRLEPGSVGATPGLAPLDPEAPLCFFTSGSTGQPKPVRKTLALLQREAEAIEALLGLAVPAGAWIHATVPHQHVYGMAFRLCWPLATGRPFSGASHALWESALAVLDGGSVLVTSPAHLARLEGIAPLPPGRRPSLVLSAGAPLSEEAARAAARVLGTAPTEIFGSSETGAVAHRARRLPDPAWRPLPGVTVGRTEDGCLRVRSPAVPGDGVHVGGDRVELDGDGGFRLLGRADRIVKIEGKRVSLPEVEEHLRRQPWVADAAALPVGDATPRLAAVVVPSAEGRALLSDLGPFRFGRRLRRELAATQDSAGLPRHWRFVDALPQGTLGKRVPADLLKLFKGDGAMTGETTVGEPGPQRPTEPEIRAVRSSGEGVELDLYLPGDLAQVDGHFPGLPIVPGVALIDWAVTLGARHGIPVAVARDFQVKFRRVTVPDSAVTLSLRHVAARRRLAFEYRAGDETLTSGTIALEEFPKDGGGQA
ncbi:AMP-binding protein [Azospirillum doebereinerae]